MRREEDPHPTGVTSRDAAVRLAQLLEDHRCVDPVVLGMQGVSDVADYFVVATVVSGAHLRGVLRGVVELTSSDEQWLEYRPHGNRKRPGTLGWELVDCDQVLVHLMDERSREFYELERLWFNAERVAVSPPS